MPDRSFAEHRIRDMVFSLRGHMQPRSSMTYISGWNVLNRIVLMSEALCKSCAGMPMDMMSHCPHMAAMSDLLLMPVEAMMHRQSLTGDDCAYAALTS